MLRFKDKEQKTPEITASKSIFYIKALQKKHRKYDKVGPTFYTLPLLRVRQGEWRKAKTSGLHQYGLHSNRYAAFAPTYCSASGRC